MIFGVRIRDDLNRQPRSFPPYPCSLGSPTVAAVHPTLAFLGVTVSYMDVTGAFPGVTVLYQ